MRVQDYTVQTVSKEIIDRIDVALENCEDHVLDFKDVEILRFTHEHIARVALKYDLVIKNIMDIKDREKIEYHKALQCQPRARDLTEFKEIFKKRFNIGDICVLDTTLTQSKCRGARRKIAKIMEYLPYGVSLRVYHSSMMQPRFFREHDGPDSAELFCRETIRFDEIFHGDIFIEFPKSQIEQHVIDVLFKE